MPRHRPELRTIQDWEDFEASWRGEPADIFAGLRELRREVYAEIEAERGRPLLVYFADTEDPDRFEYSVIDPKDIDGFTDLVNECEPSKSVDVLLHSGGGEIETTERIVKILRAKFDEVHFLIPHSAYSAATMLALSGDSITLYRTATLGPIDPQIYGEPAANIALGFENAKKAIVANPAVTPAYLPLIEQYTLPLLEKCNDATSLSRDLAGAWLTKYMFKDQPDRAEIIERAADYFADYKKHRTHARSIGWDEVKDMGLKIHLTNGALAKLMREAYIMLHGLFLNDLYAKVYENSSHLSYAHFVPLPPSEPAPTSQEMSEQAKKKNPKERSK